MFSGLNLFIEQNNGPPASLAFAQVSVHVNRICYWKIFSKYQGTIHKIKGYTDGIKHRQVGDGFWTNRCEGFPGGGGAGELYKQRAGKATPCPLTFTLCWTRRQSSGQRREAGGTQVPGDFLLTALWSAHTDILAHYHCSLPVRRKPICSQAALLCGSKWALHLTPLPLWA